MQKFIAIESWTPKRWRYSFKIYKVKYNELIYIWTWDFTYASTRGSDSEVMNKLIELKEIPKKYYGYYTPNKKFKITYILPLNQK